MSDWSIPAHKSYRQGFRQKTLIVLAFISAVICLSVLIFSSVLSDSQNASAISQTYAAGTSLTTLDIFDVGQGNAALLCFSDGKTLLVDSGPPSSKTALLSYLKQRDVDNLDCFVLTHQHGDHAGNVESVLGACRVQQIVFPKAPVDLLIDPSRFEGIYKDISDYGLLIHNPDKGEVLMSGEGYSVTVLSDDSGSYKTLNDYSIVLRVVVGDVSFLLMADAESFTEQQLLHTGVYLNSDILLVGHHGNRNAVSVPFLDAVTPDIAVISVGENNFGQPSAAVLNRLEASDIPCSRTDEVGTVTFETDGLTYQVYSGLLNAA